MLREARIENWMSVGFRGTVLEDAGVGGGEEMRGVDVGFGALNEGRRVGGGVEEG